jgi:DME family drug/metabolite transporter
MYGELLAVFSAFCWAAGGAVYKKGLEYTDAWMGNFMRISATAVAFLVFMAATGVIGVSISSITLELLFWVITSAVFAFFVGDLFYMLALERAGVARVVPVSSTYPLFVALWAAIFYGIPSPSIIAGSLLVVVAIYLISRQRDGDEDKKGSRLGVLFAVFAAISWSISISILDYLTAHLPAEAVAGFRFIIASALLSPVVLKKGVRFNWNAFKWLGIGGMTILVLGNYTFVEAIRIVGSAKVAPISATYPVIAAILARMFLKENLTLEIVAGTVLSLIGVLLVISA